MFVNYGQVMLGFQPKTYTTPPLTSAVIELHYAALWGPHYSLWLICNDWLSSTSRAQMDSLIDYTQTKKIKKKIQWSNTKHWLWKTISTASFTITHSIIPLVYFSTPPLPQKNMLLIRPACVCFYVRLCEWWTDSSEPLFLHTGPALIGFGLGTHIPAVLEIHQPWQVYCTTTLHRLWPTTRTKISLSIRKTFMSRDGGGFEMAAGGKPGCWFKLFASKKDHVQIQ